MLVLRSREIYGPFGGVAVRIAVTDGIESIAMGFVSNAVSDPPAIVASGTPMLLWSQSRQGRTTSWLKSISSESLRTN